MAKQERQAEFVRWFGPLLTAWRDLGGTMHMMDIIGIYQRNSRPEDDR
jgi:hypothetical protein